jgi:hypothetical protein
MKNHGSWIRTFAFSITAGLIASSAAAQSVGVYRGASGAKDVSMASAGSVLGDTPVAALAWNPAGLAAVEAPEFDLAFATVSARAASSRIASTATGC